MFPLHFVKEEYARLARFISGSLRLPTWIMAAVFFLSVAGGGMFVVLYPQMAEKIILEIVSMFSQKGITTAEGQPLAMTLICNNLIATGFCMSLGMIPFLFLPALALAENGFIFGFLGAYMTSFTGNPTLFLLGTIPHSIFELPALILSAALGCHLCLSLIRKIFGRRRQPFLECLADALRAYLLLVLPLLLLSGMIEAFITPALLSQFGGL